MPRRIVPALLALPLALGPALAAPAEPAPGAAPIRLTGAVRLRAGAPAVTLELHPAWEEPAAARERLAGRAPAPLATARLGAGGRFELAAPGAGAYRLEARAAGRVPMAFQLPALVEETELPPLTLPPAAPLEVLAAGPDGKPAGGIEIRAETEVPLEHQGTVAWRPAARTGRTGADGRLVLPRAAGERVLLAVLTPARLVAEPPRSPHQEIGGTVRLVLPGPRPVVLAAVDPDGRPVPGALVRVQPFDSLAATIGATGPDGRLEIAAPVRLDLRLLLEDGQGRLGEVTVSPSQAGRAAPLAVRLDEPRAVRGRVLSAGTAGARKSAPDRPLPGALVAPWGLVLSGPPVRTAADGTFQLRLPRHRQARLDAAAAGHLELRKQALRPGDGTELRLQPAAVLAGEVVDGAGRPVAGAMLWTPLSWGASASAWSGRDGRFRLAGLLPDGVYHLTVTGEGFARTSARLRTAAAGRAPVPARVVLDAGRALAGQVVDGEGQPLPGAELTLRRPLEGDNGWGELPADAEEPRRAAADRRGRFRIPGVNGRYDLAIRRPGAAQVELPVEIAPGAGDVDLGPLVLPAGLALEGRVVGGEGSAAEPLPGAEVTWTRFLPDGSVPVAPPEPGLATGPDGRFRIADLAPGQRLDLTIRHPVHAPRTLRQVQAIAGSEPLEIELAPARALSGRVLGPAGEPVAGAQLSSSRIETAALNGTTMGRDLLGQTGTDGRFHVAGLAPGLLDLQISAPGFQTRDVEGLAIPADRDVDGVEVRLEPGVALEGRVTRQNGDPVEGALVHVGHESRFLGRRPGAHFRPWRPSRSLAQTDADGRYRIEGLDPGPHRVEVQAERDTANAVAELTAGVHRLDLVLDETAPSPSVAGRVVDEEGAPVPAAEVQLSAAQSGFPGQGTFTQPDGSFVLEQVRPGTYRLSARGAGIVDPETGRQVQVAGGPVEGIEVRVSRSDGITLTGRLLGLAPDEARWVRIDAWLGFGLQRSAGAVEPPDGYRIAGLYAGTWVVSAVHADGRYVRRQVELGPEPEPRLDLEFPGGFTLRGRATLDGAPFAGAWVVALPSEPVADRLTPQTPTAQDGSFAFRHLRPGRYRLFVQDDRSGMGGGLEVSLEADQTVQIDLATAPLQGRVLAADGTQVEGATILLTSRNHPFDHTFRVPTLRTGAEGAFGPAKVAPGTYRITVEAEGFATQQLEVEVRPQAGWTGEVRLEPGTSTAIDL